MKKILILGAGGFGQMVKETAEQLGYDEIAFLDDAAKGSAVIGKCCDYSSRFGEYQTAVAAFGNNNTRLYWTNRFWRRAMRFRRSSIFCGGESKRHSGAGMLCDAESRGEYPQPDREGCFDQQRSCSGS